MNLESWIPSLIVLAVIPFAIFVGRTYITNYFANAIKYDFETQLEAVKTSLRTKETEIASLRETILVNRRTRQGEVDKRTIVAIDAIWSAILEWQKIEYPSQILGIVNYEKLSEEAPDDPKLRQFIEMIAPNNISLESMQDFGKGVDAHRPYIPNTIWANFSAYRSVIMRAVVKIDLLKKGISQNIIANEDGIKKVMKAAMPEFSAYIDEHGDNGFHGILVDLKEKILISLQNLLEGNDLDSREISRSIEIMKAIENLNGKR